MTPIQKKFLKVAIGGTAVTVGLKKGNDAWGRRIAKLPQPQANREQKIRKGLGIAVGGYLAANLGAGIYVGNKIGRKMVADYAKKAAGPPMAGFAHGIAAKAPSVGAHTPFSPIRSMSAKKRVVLPTFKRSSSPGLAGKVNTIPTAKGGKVISRPIQPAPLSMGAPMSFGVKKKPAIPGSGLKINKYRFLT